MQSANGQVIIHDNEKNNNVATAKTFADEFIKLKTRRYG